MICFIKVILLILSMLFLFKVVIDVGGEGWGEVVLDILVIIIFISCFTINLVYYCYLMNNVFIIIFEFIHYLNFLCLSIHDLLIHVHHRFYLNILYYCHLLLICLNEDLSQSFFLYNKLFYILDLINYKYIRLKISLIVIKEKLIGQINSFMKILAKFRNNIYVDNIILPIIIMIILPLFNNIF